MVPFTSAILFAIRARRLLLPLPVAASIARCLLAILLRSTDTSMSLFLSREPIFAEDGIKYRCICLPYFRSWDGGNRWDLHRTFLQFFNQPKHPCCGNILFVSRIVAGNVAPFPSREIVCRFAQRLAVNFAIFHKG